MALDQVFSLTPRASYSVGGAGHLARIEVHGGSMLPKYASTARASFDHQHAEDEVFVAWYDAGDEAINYALFSHRRRVPRVELAYDLSAFGPSKEVALTFRFDAVTDSRVLVYSDAGWIGEEALIPGDNQFLVQVESTDPLHLYFVHANLEGQSYGGSWYFRGIDGYVA